MMSQKLKSSKKCQEKPFKKNAKKSKMSKKKNLQKVIQRIQKLTKMKLEKARPNFKIKNQRSKKVSMILQISFLIGGVNI